MPDEIEASILRLAHAEKWPPGTIARQLGVHHSVVERVLRNAQVVVNRRFRRRSKLDPYIEFIKQTLEKYPSVTASRLLQMVRERGYIGRPSHFRDRISDLRPRPRAEAFLRLRTLPGEQAQVDWAHFGKVKIGRAERPLMAFVMVLSYSRAIYLRFYLGQQGSNFLRGHEMSFAFFGGVARVHLYDNLKSAVMERVGDAIRFNPDLLAFASHYRYEPRPVAVYRGNEKGRVERAIQYVRTAFFAARTWKDLADLNDQAERWCLTEAMDRAWVEDRRRTVREVLVEERPRLLPLPGNSHPTDERVAVSVGKSPYVRFDWNHYSVPATFVRRTLVVFASLTVVRIVDGDQLVATHNRSFDAKEQIERPEHIAELEQQKRHARQSRGLDRLARAAPSSRDLLIEMAQRGQNLGAATSWLLRLLDEYGAEALDLAVKEAIQKGSPHPQAVRHVLERDRATAGLPAPLPLELPDDPRIKNLTVRVHDLKNYTSLKGQASHDVSNDNRKADQSGSIADPT